MSADKIHFVAAGAAGAPNSSSASMPPGVITTPQPNAYYCCKCQFGPMLCTLYPACIQCGHTFGPAHCQPVYIKGNAALSQSQAISLSGTKATPAGAAIAAAPSAPIPQMVAAAPPVQPTNAPLALVGSDFKGVATETDPVLVNQGHDSDSDTDFDGVCQDGEEIWYCHQCNSGPYNAAYIPSCLNCHHKQCYYCPTD